MWIPLGYHHHSFTAVQRRYHTNVRELLASALTTLRFSHLLRDCHIISWVDHSNLLYLSRSENPRLLRIALMLIGAGFNVTFAYTPGAGMHLPDTLSRGLVGPVAPLSKRPVMPDPSASSLPLVAAAVALSVADPAAVPVPDSPRPSATAAPTAPLPAATAAPASDYGLPFFPSDIVVPGLPPNTHPIVHAVVHAQQSMPASARRDVLSREHASEKRLGSVMTLYIASRLHVPAQLEATAIQQAYLAAVHLPVCASAADMIERLRGSVKVCWDSMSADASRFCASCGRCQHAAAGSRPVAVGRMSPFLYPAPNHTLLIDFFGPLPVCRRASPLDPTGAVHDYTYIISLVDGFSRFALFLPSTHKSAAAAIAAFLLVHILRHPSLCALRR